MVVRDIISNFVVRKEKDVDLRHYEKTNWNNSIDFSLSDGMQYRQ